MSWPSIYRILKPDFLMLLPILALASYLTFIPHLDYPYPVHVDEWMHLARSKALLQAGTVTYADPFYSDPTIPLFAKLETGFYLFWAVFHQISGISWLTIFRYFPSFVFVITVLSVYILARREGFGWEAAFFASLIPTTIGILGPAFLVPVAMGLLFIPLSIFVAYNFRTGWSYLVLSIFTCFLLSMHAATAVGLVIILVPFILLNIKGNFKHSLGISLAIVIPFLAPFPLVFDMLLPTTKSLLLPQPLPSHVVTPHVILSYGYFPVLFCLLGVFLLVIRGGRRNYSLVLGLMALLVMLVTSFIFHYGLPIMYYRGLMYMMLMMGIIAGVGLMGVKNLKLPSKLAARLNSPFITRNIGAILCLIFISLTLAISIPSHLDTPYYYMIDDQDYKAFIWIRENVGDEYEKAILDPWKGTAFTAITGKILYTKILAFPKSTDEEAHAFLNEGCIDTAFLREKGISIIYTRLEVNNPDLVQVRQNVYLLKEASKNE